MSSVRVTLEDMLAVMEGQTKFLPLPDGRVYVLRKGDRGYWLTPAGQSAILQERDDARVGEALETPPASPE